MRFAIDYTPLTLEIIMRFRLIPRHHVAALKDYLDTPVNLVTIAAKPGHLRRSIKWFGVHRYQRYLQEAATRPVHETVAESVCSTQPYPPAIS